ncbi:MAG: hypothetical protein PHO56_05370, partial [Patescibacteria group bacterium]|nr:hypothetical protein [Patescibacteria group bacterium]
MPLNEEKNNPVRSKRGLAGRKNFLAILFLASILFFAASRPTYALGLADVFAPITAAYEGLKYVGDRVYNIGKDLIGYEGSIALQQAVMHSLNTIAYDTATWLGSGGAGQKPQYFSVTPIHNLENISNAAAGQFISSFGQQEGVNFCKLSANAKLSIGLGLVGAVKPPDIDCTASQMMTNWGIGNTKNFLKNFSGYFDVTQNDLGAALTAQTSLLTAQENAKLNQIMQQQLSGRYNELSNIAGNIVGLPNQAEMEADVANGLYSKNMYFFTGNALQDAAGVFINQFIASEFKNAQRKLTALLSSGNNSSPNNSFGNFQAAPQTGGVAAAQGVLRKIFEPNFSSNADLDILATLSICGNSVFGGVGPTDCVLDENLRQAITNRETVAEALADGSLKGGAPFGFVMGGDNKPIEPAWNQGYPYRSLIILRKYRIIPVGWEIAAEYIQSHPNDVQNHNNLNDLMACYDPNDSYRGYNDDGSQKWCEGLIDPTWVLKAPQNYCAKQGYGPQILDSQTVDQGTDDKGNKLPPKLTVTRSDTYCGDEQSCIKENADGSCKYFGYCAGDKRLWKFGASGSCDAQYNTCQTFTDTSGNQVSYLKNSLQYCDATNAGCNEYAIASPASYNNVTGNLDWTKNSGSIFLNKNATPCDQSNEGCHEFLRYTSGLGTNLIIDSDFENDTVDSVLSDWKANVNTKVSDNPPSGASGNALYVIALPFSSTAEIDSFDRSESANPSAMPAGFVMEPEVSYTLSADVYLQAGNSVTIGIGREGSTWQTASTNITGSWQRISVTLLNNKDILANEIKIYGTGAMGGVKFYVDNLKFEVGNAPTRYTAYRGNNLVYEKFMPAYLRDACYNNPAGGDYSLKNNLSPAQQSVCGNFARQCNQDEVNCDSFTNNDNPNQAAIPAAVTEVDTCPLSCVGYNTYIQSADNFSSAHVKYFIPSTAQTCSAAAVGCEEFTNLDKSAQGGEQKEYYSYLRQCVKPT